jgi:hypothetical protein
LQKKKFFAKLRTSYEQLLGVLHIISLRIQNAAQEIRQNNDILNRVWLSWTHRAEAWIANNGKHLEQLL